MSILRPGNIVYYEDIKDCGYPIHSKQGMSFDKVIRVQPDGHPVKIHPMKFRFKEFWEDNKHLECRDSEVPKDIVYLHDFMNWYEDKYGGQPVIKRGGKEL